MRTDYTSQLETILGHTDTFDRKVRRKPALSPQAVNLHIRRWLAGKLIGYVISLLSIIIFLWGWNTLSVHKINFGLDFANVPSAQAVAKHLAHAAASKAFYINVLVSVKRVWLAFAAASLLGCVLGLSLARISIMRHIFLPFVEIFRPIPAIAWIPLAILMFPTTESSILFIVFLGAIFPVILNTYQGATEVPSQLLRAARSLGASRLSVLWHVIIPSSLPNIATGLSVGMGIAWFSLLTAEMIGGQNGIGNYTWESYQLIKYPDIIVGMITIGVLSTVSSGLINLMCKPLLRWSGHR